MNETERKGLLEIMNKIMEGATEKDMKEFYRVNKQAQRREN